MSDITDGEKRAIQDYIESMGKMESTPFRNAALRRDALGMGVQMVTQYRYLSNEFVLQQRWISDIACHYDSLQTWFFRQCEIYDLPLNNAVAFWNSFCEQHDSIVKANADNIAKLLYAATCNFGDFFLWATTRSAPAEFVWPMDVDTTKNTDSQNKRIQEVLDRQLSILRLSLPERSDSLLGFYGFNAKWYQHFQNAKSYYQWWERYSSCNIVEPVVYAEDWETCFPLVACFRQYVNFLNEFSNSKHLTFEKRWDEFLKKEENSLFSSFQNIVFMLKSNPELAEIAPIYVLYLFQKKTTKLYDSKNGIICRLLPSKRFIEPHEAKLYSSAPTNIRVPQEAAVFTYQVLCELFHSYPNLLCVPYNKGLCDYMMQSMCYLIGEPYYKVDAAQIQKILSAEEVVLHYQLKNSPCWVHSLLQEIDERLSSALGLYADNIPHIIHPHHMLSDDKTKTLNNSVKKFLNDDFLEDYLRIFILPPQGLGSPRVPSGIMMELADLIDKKLSIINSSVISHVKEDAAHLLAIEKCVHHICTTKIYDKFYLKILGLLHNYFQSEDFIHGNKSFVNYMTRLTLYSSS